MTTPFLATAIALSTIINLIVGFIWYGPLFGKPWMRAANINPEAMAKFIPWRTALQILGAFLMPFVLSHALIFGSAYFATTAFWSLLPVACMLWLGFIVPVTLAPILWEGKSWKFWAINAGFYLVSIVLSTAVIAQWL